MTVDGTFIKGHFVLTILLAVRINVNDQTTLLVWAIVESKNKSFWAYFFYHLHVATGALLKEEYIIISDHDKGLKALTNKETRNYYHAQCCKHICDNFIAKWGGQTIALYFWAVAWAHTSYKFQAAMNRLEILKSETAQYLRQIDLAIYAEVFFSEHCFEHDTQNIAEFINKKLLRAREGSTLELLNDVWIKLIINQFTQYQTALTV